VFHYLDDEGLPVGVRMGDWKVVYAENRGKTMALWAEPFVKLRMPKVHNLRRDPWSRAEYNSNSYYDWMLDKVPYVYLAWSETAKFLQTFKSYPPSQKADSWTIDKMTEHALKQTE
jgi:arylsulfatase